MLNKKILIIGGCGYVGSALFRRLEHDPEYSVDTVDLEWFGNFTNPLNLKLDYRKLPGFFFNHYDVVILLAGHSSVPMANNSDPRSTFKNNVDNFVDLLTKLKPGMKFIYAGSSSVYNGILDDNVTEDYNLLNPVNMYDTTKQDLDKYIIQFPQVEFYGLRFATVNGVSENLRTDIMINLMVETALKDKQVKLSNEHIRRPILHIDDLVEAIKTIIDCTEDKRGIYNLSSFNGTAGSIAEEVSHALWVDLVRVEQKELERTLNSKLPVTYDFSVSSDKFQKAFGFEFKGSARKIAMQIADKLEDKESGIHTTKRSRAVKYDV
jgi:nucleoside-diphosphate-sugar epimerase